MVSMLYLYIPVAWVVSQVLKVCLDSIKHQRFRLSSLFSHGGMPSSHATLVSALVMAVGLAEGFGSTLFIISLVFALIVLYDAWGHHLLRRHSTYEVVAGIVVAVIIVLLGWLVH